MRYLRRQVINRRAPWDQRLQVDINNNVLMTTPAALQLPAGTTLERPIVGSLYGSGNPTDVRGMIRYNTDTDQLEGFQDGAWRSFRFKEPTGIIQQNLGSGDANNVFFGPLNPAPIAGAPQVGITWDRVQFAKQILVLVENVIQVSGTNYTVAQNPTIPGQVYAGDTSVDALAGATIVEFDTTTLPIYPSVNIIGATVTGNSSLQSNTVITNYTINNNNELTSITIDKPLITATIPAGTTLTITDTPNVAPGYYLQFSSPVPLGKPVIVLHGFDQ